MKRKASFLDEPSPSAEWPSFDYASSASTTSPESVKTLVDHDQTQAYWNVGRIPYMNSRTRKRYRDDRPNEQTVHQNTLAKLFDAQKQMHIEEQRARDWQMMSSPAVSPLTQWPPHTDSRLNGSMSMFPAQNDPPRSQPEKNQRSLDSFFGGGAARRQAQMDQSPPTSLSVHGPQAMTPMLLKCEDCNSTLQSTNGDLYVSDADAMSVDLDSQHDEWSCASCSRRVCDTCAVRGDYRICLECAVPGGG